MSDTEELREALLEKSHEIEGLRQENAQVRLLLDSLQALLTCDPGEDPFAAIFASLASVFPFSEVLVLAEEEENPDRLVTIAAQPADLKGLAWRAGRLFRKVLGGRVTASVYNQDFEEWQGEVADRLDPAQPALYLPMRVRDRRGLLILLRPAGDEGFDRGHVSLARRFSLLASAAFAALYTRQQEKESESLRQLAARLRASERELAYRANFDPLTGLPNRSLIEEKVDAAIAALKPGAHLALAFIDLDKFKQVNDFYNHSVGDALLVAVAARIQQNIRGSDLLARISGDEFVLLLNPLKTLAEAQGVIDRIIDHLKKPFHIEGRELFTSASTGVSVFPGHGSSYEELRRTADLAMYRAKSHTKGSVVFFDRSVGEASEARMEMEQRLRAAVRDQRFRCAFQPKVDIRSNRVTGFEALVRWIDDEGQVRAPGDFIDVAADLGLLNDISGLVLSDAVRAFTLLDPTFGAETTISLNIAAKQISDRRFMERFLAEIEASGYARRFMLEITEETVVEANPFQSEILPALRQRGIGVSIDDFGSGYSSFSVLTDITADELKVDRAFITAIDQRPRSQGILKAMESLAGALGMVIVAEGAETEAEMAYLRNHSVIGVVQGYYFARPMVAAELVAYWRQRWLAAADGPVDCSARAAALNSARL